MTNNDRPRRRLLFLDPYHKGSHAAFARSVDEMLTATGEWEVIACTLPGVHWKWRMQGAAAHFALELAEMPAGDLIMTTDMCDVSRLRGLLPRQHRDTPIVLYFHENQLTFPWSAGDPDLAMRIDLTYGMTNVMSSLAADGLWFNSRFHRDAFLDAAEMLMAKMPDARIELGLLREKSQVLSIPLPLERMFGDAISLDLDRPLHQPLRVLWNHRWSLDKGMDRFFRSLDEMTAASIDFELILLGVGADDEDSVWNKLLKKSGHRVLHRGTTHSREDYTKWLRQADVLVHHPRQEFFGISVVEAMWHGVLPAVQKIGSYIEYVPDEFTTNSTVAQIKKWQELQASEISRLRAYVHESITQFCHTSQQNSWSENLTKMCEQ